LNKKGPRSGSNVKPPPWITKGTVGCPGAGRILAFRWMKDLA
jgi:hypothetical protein